MSCYVTSKRLAVRTGRRGLRCCAQMSSQEIPDPSQF